MPENTNPQPAELGPEEPQATPPRPTPPSVPSSAQSPAENIRDAIDTISCNIGISIKGGLEWLRSKTTINNPEQAVETAGVIKTIGQTIKHAALAFPAMGVRTATEIAETGCDVIAGGTGTVSRPIMHPKETAKHPINYISENPLRATNSLVTTALNFFPNRLDELYNGILKPITQRITNKIPVAGRFIKMAGDGIGLIPKFFRKGMEKCTGWLRTKNSFSKASYQE